MPLSAYSSQLSAKKPSARVFLLIADSRGLLRGAPRTFLGGGLLRRALRFGAALLEAPAQALHQVDDLRLARLGHLVKLHLLALQLALDDAKEVLAILVRVLRGIPFGREVVDQRFRHVELRL